LCHNDADAGRWDWQRPIGEAIMKFGVNLDERTSG